MTLMTKGGLGSWENAARHPVRTLMLAFVGVGVGIGLITYFDGVGRSVWVSVVAGLGCATAVSVMTWRGITAERDGKPPEVSIRPISAVSVTALVTGVGIIIWGLVVGNFSLAAGGAPLAVLGGVLLLVRARLSARA
jgi:hypothetical protein